MTTVGLIAVALAAMLALPVTAGAQTAEADAELNRVRDLVRAGALPRRKLLEAEKDRLAHGYRETLNRTLLSDELEPSELPTMLDAARKLQAIAQERFDLALARVEAGVLPARSLEKERDALAAAKRQAELARTRADLVRQRARMVAAESYLEELEGEELAYRFEGFNDYEQEALSEIDEMYYLTFGESPPVSAEGATAMHRAMGLDHTGRIDVALHPDSDEGMFLIYLLEGLGIPYIAFRSAVPGQATGPHIHIGPPSERIEDQDAAPGIF